MKIKFMLFLGLVAIVLVIYYGNINSNLFLFVNKNKSNLIKYTEEHFGMSLLIYFSIYVCTVVFSLPGPTILSLLGGMLFGVWLGTLMTLVSSTFGATLIFWFSRYGLKSYLGGKYEFWIQEINTQFIKHGSKYHLTLRLAPVFPFYLVNLLMGFTHIKTRQYIIECIIGMLPLTYLYSLAGTQFIYVNKLNDLISINSLSLFTFITLIPWFLSFLFKKSYSI